MTLAPYENAPDEPQEGDWVTEDHVTFVQYGYLNQQERGLVVRDGKDWRAVLRAAMDQEQFWPDVWFLSDHGNWHPLSVETER